MRLIGFDTFASLKGAAVPRVLPIVRRARACLDHMAPARHRVVEKIRAQPKLAGAIDGVAGGWMKLVESFCAMLDPVASRYFPVTRLVVVPTETGDFELHKVFKGTVSAFGSLATIERAEIAKTKWTAIELRLRPEQLMQRTLSLPASSRDFLGPILEHRLERLTPWRPERVLYGYQVNPDAESGGVSVQLTATSKDFVAKPLQTLAGIGLVPTAIGSQDGSLLQPLHLNLLRDTASGAHADLRLVVSRSALAVFSILVIAYAGSSYWASIANEAEREAGSRHMKARRLLKTASMGNVGDRERSLLEAKQPEKAMVVLVDKLAQVIPDDTFLKEFALTPDKVRLVGSSGNAPALIGKLESIGLVNVRFAAAVTREKDQRDSFEITADQATSRKVDGR